MKHKNLEILQGHGLPVPPFTLLYADDRADLSFSDAPLFAVRSSAFCEDGTELSFAGQFDTLLNVKREDVDRAVSKVRESVNNAGAREYMNASGLSHGCEMCVIVQEMVSAEVSGVIFTANPLGILNETVITVGNGLGEGVVRDLAESSTYYYNNDDHTYVYSTQEGAPLLTSETVERLIELSSRIKDVFSYEADIEFAVEKGSIYILQVRPITALPQGEVIVLDNSNIVESYPGVSLPLTQDFVRRIYYGIFKSCVRRFSGDRELTEELDPILRNMVDVADSRIYYRISNWYHLIRLLPFSKKLIPVWQQMLGVGNKEVTLLQSVRVSKKTKVRILSNAFAFLHRTPKMMEELNGKFVLKYPQYRQGLRECTAVSQYLELFEYIYDDILTDWDITRINDLYTFVFTALSGKNNRERLADIRSLESMKPVLEMDKLIRLAADKGVDCPEYLKAEEEYVEGYGDRCLGELKLEAPTYRTDPQMLRAQVLSGKSVELPRINEGRRKALSPFVKRARRGIENREISRMNRSRLFGISRDIFLGIGDILVRNGQLEKPQDVFYLHMSELTSLDDMRQTVVRRRADEEHFRAMPGFSRLVYSGSITDHKASNEGLPAVREGRLMGIPTSCGIIEGEVLVVEQACCGMDTTGKILVTRSTDPGWVFLIKNAAGIIAERGSLLSHTAIISRELHKPAVVNVKDCTKILRTGDRVLLDADNGTVTLL